MNETELKRVVFTWGSKILVHTASGCLLPALLGTVCSSGEEGNPGSAVKLGSSSVSLICLRTKGGTCLCSQPALLSAGLLLHRAESELPEGWCVASHLWKSSSSFCCAWGTPSGSKAEEHPRTGQSFDF